MTASINIQIVTIDHLPVDYWLQSVYNLTTGVGRVDNEASE